MRKKKGQELSFSFKRHNITSTLLSLPNCRVLYIRIISQDTNLLPSLNFYRELGTAESSGNSRLQGFSEFDSPQKEFARKSQLRFGLRYRVIPCRKNLFQQSWRAFLLDWFYCNSENKCMTWSQEPFSRYIVVGFSRDNHLLIRNRCAEPFTTCWSAAILKILLVCWRPNWRYVTILEGNMNLVEQRFPGIKYI